MKYVDFESPLYKELIEGLTDSPYYIEYFVAGSYWNYDGEDTLTRTISHDNFELVSTIGMCSFITIHSTRPTKAAALFKKVGIGVVGVTYEQVDWHTQERVNDPVIAIVTKG